MNIKESKSNITVLTSQPEDQRQAAAIADKPRLVSVTQGGDNDSGEESPQLQLLNYRR